MEPAATWEVNCGDGSVPSRSEPAQQHPIAVQRVGRDRDGRLPLVLGDVCRFTVRLVLVAALYWQRRSPPVPTGRFRSPPTCRWPS